MRIQYSLKPSGAHRYLVIIHVWKQFESIVVSRRVNRENRLNLFLNERIIRFGVRKAIIRLVSGPDTIIIRKVKKKLFVITASKKHEK